MVSHIAFIIDGNRRWAKERNLSKLKGHIAGKEKVIDVIKWCDELNIKEVTIYALSSENLKREASEVAYLLGLLKDVLNDIFIKKPDLNVRIIGRKYLFSKDMVNLISKVEDDCGLKKGIKLNLCIGYGGRQEIVDATNKAIKNGKLVDEKSFEDLLDLKSSPDLVIRTGGQIRTSNFLPWQTIYSEWFFLKEYWPDFTKDRLLEVIDEFKSRVRNFGK